MGASDFLRKKAEETRTKGADTTRYDEKTGVRLDNGNDSYNTVWENYKRVKASDLAPKVAGGTVNPIISFGNVRENPVLKRKTNTTKTYSQALTESRNKAKVLENGAKLPTVIPPKGDVSKLILPDTGGGGTVNPTLKRNEVRTNYDYMTDREAAVYKYYRDRGQVEKAQEYLDALEMDVNQRAAMQKREDAKKLAEESTAAALYARAVGNIGQAAGAVYAAAMEGADKPVDPYHPLMGGVNMNEGLAEGLMGDSTGAEKFAKEAGLAVFDWGTQAATLGPLTPYVMAAGAAAGNTKEALERGGTTDEAVMYGLAGGAAEAITEKLGYDRLFELGKITKNKGAVSTFLKSLLPQAASEGAEEATSEIANILADTLIMGDNSQMKQIAQTAMENGATESEAVKTALMEGIKQVGYSGAVGAASGGVIAGGIGGLSRMTGRNTLEMAGNPVETARDAMTNAGNEVTQRTMKSRTRSEVPEGTQTETMLNEQGNVLPERENMLPEQGNVMVNRENVPEVTQQNKALRDFGEKYYYTEGQKLVNEEAERRGDTSFIPAFQTYYTAGLTGVKESDIKQTAETIVADKGLLRAAYLAGANDRKADLEARMKGTGKMGQTAGVFLETDAVTKEQRSLAELVSRVAELEVVLVDELPQDRRGYYENNKGRVTIALNSGQFAGTLFHEATHYIREANPEGYDRLRNAVFSAAAAMKGMDLESYTKKYEKMYGEAYREAGQEVDYDMILEEMTADAFAEIAGDEKTFKKFVKEMQNTNPSVLEKIKEFLENLLETLKGLVNDGRFSSFGGEIRKDVKATEKFATMLAEETKKAGEMQRGEKTEKKGEKKEKKYSFAGEKARTADREKLDMAKKMEEEGKTRREIYDKTGWFRGADDQWRFEIDDSQMQYRYAGVPGLSAYLQNTELFEAYPELQNVTIKFEKLKNGVRGIYNKEENEITLDESLKEEPGTVLLHEIQHAIQKIEGHASGANREYWERRIEKGFDTRTADEKAKEWNLTKQMEKLKRKNPEFYQEMQELDTMVPTVPRGRIDWETLEQIEPDPIEWQLYDQRREQLEEKYGVEMVWDYTDLKYELDQSRKGSGRTAFDLYYATAGEIEARDTEKRMHFTKEDRKKWFPNIGDEDTVFAEGVKFSLKEPIEETKDLIAVHNMNTEDLKRTLQLGGMPMPSIAIVKGKMGHENFGEISLVFGKDTIDPEGMKENRVYGADAWTPTVPQIDYEVDSKKAKAFENEVGERASRFADGIFSSYSVLRSIGVDESTRKTENEVVKELAGQDAVIAAYLEEQGKAMEPVYEYKEKSYDRHGNDALRAYIQKKGTDELRKLVQDMESGAVDWMEAVKGEMDRYRESIEPELRKRAQGFFKSRPAEAVEKKVTERLKKEMVPNRVREFIEHAWELQSKPAETEGQVDRNATREKMRKMVDAEAVEKWVKEKTKGMLGEAGIYNGKDPYTPSGKQRTFAQMHYAYTLENLVKAMKGNQQEKGEGLWGATARGLQAVTSREYRSIAQIRGDKGRLQQVDEGEYKAELEAIDREIESIVSEIKKTNKAHSDNTYTESDIIGAVMLEAAQGRHTKAAIKKAFANNDYDISDMVAGKMANVFESVMELPTTYFEAKPQRAVMVDEIRAAIVPDDLGADVVEQMEKAGVPVITYEAGNEESRKEALNSVEGVRFSIREEAYDALVEENEALKEANEALRRQFEITKDAVHDPVSAKKAVRKWLKVHDSEYDVDDFTEKFVALADYVANAGDKVDFQKVMGALQKLAYDALSESKVLNTDLSDAYKDFKDDVRKTKIKVTEDMAEEFDYYGGYNTVRKENFGKINLSRQGGIYADVFYQEMAEKYPELLDVERVSTQVDVVMDLLDVVDSLQPIYENPYGMNLDEYAMDAAYDLWEMYFDIELQKPTFADKYEKKLEKEKARARAARENLRKDLKERYDEKLQQAKEDQKKKLAEEKEKYIKRIDNVLKEKDKLQRKLETQWEAHRNSMQQADQRELARLMSEGRKTAAKMRKLKEKGDQYKEKLDQMMEEEQEWISAYEALMKEKKAEYRQNLKDLEQRMKEEQRRKLDDARLAAAMHEGRALLEQRRAIYEKLKARDKERRDRAEYAKYKNIIEKEAALLKRWVERPTDQYHVQESMMEGVRNFLEKMKFDDPDLNIMPTDIRRMMKDYKAMTAENTMLYAEEDENVQEMLESLADRVGDGVKVSELGPTEMRQLSVVIRSVSHLVRNANRMVSIKNGEKISTIGNAYMEDVENKKTKNPDSRLRVLSDMMNVQMLDTESFFKEMGKTVHDTIYRGLREGFDRKILHVKEASEFMQKTVDKKKIREWGEMEPKEYTLSGGKILLTDAQIMSLYCLMRRTQARGHIFGGGIKGEPVVHKVRGQRKIVKNTEPVEVTAADVTKLMSNLTEEQKKAALEIQGYLESVASWGNEVTMNMLGYKKFTETNYFPIVTDENYINTMYGARGEKNSTLQTMGITKQTNREAKNPIILENIFDAYVRHIDQMSSYNAFVPALSDLNKFMNYREMVRVVDGKKFGENRSVKETMQRVMGPAGDKYVRDLMERLNNPAVKEDVERLPRIFLRNMKIASVGANLRVIIQQPVSYLRAADEIGVGYLMGALVPSKTDFQKVYEYAPIAQWKEWGNYEMNVGRTMKELLIGQNFYESFLEKSMIVAGIMDKLTWGRIWRAAELEVKKKHPELTGNRYYETVGKRFSEIIDGTQVVDSILHRNQMMRSQSLFSQMATSFMSEPTKTYNMMRNSMVAVIKDNTPENRKKVVRTFMTLVANGVCVAAAAGLVDMLRDDDDDETLLEKWLQAFRGDFSEAESVSDYILAAIGSNLGNSFNPLGYIPYMRDIFSVIQGYTVQRTDISWLNDLVKSGKNLMRYMEGESNYTLNAVLMDAAGSLSKATGIPINSAKRDILAIKNTIVNYTLGLDAQYADKKMTYDVGSEKNASMYVKMMLEAKMSGNDEIATRIYNDMVKGGVSNETIDNKIKSAEVKAIKEEPEAMEAARAYNEGRVDDYTRNVEALAKKRYFMENIESAVESLTKPPTEEDEETFETITKDYWKEEGEVESADYALLFNAYMNGNMADYDKMWSILNAAGKEDNSIRSSMRSRLKSEYWKAKEAGDSQRMQRAADEFYRLGGKRETLEKPPK